MSEAQITPRCTHCASPFVRWTRPRALHEYLGRLVQRAPFQCQICGYRFTQRHTSRQTSGATRDRRHFDRLVTRIPVTVAEEHGEAGEGIAMDLSIAGCQLHTRTPVAVGDTLWVALHPTDAPHPIIIERAVVRSVHPSTVGVQFVQFATAARASLSQLVRMLLTEQRASA